jgi:homocysteine S-methyltransferase
MTTTTTTTSSSSSSSCTAAKAEGAGRRPRLQDWFSSGTATATAVASAERNGDAAPAERVAAASWDRILLLDGGVSTHLAAKVTATSNNNDHNDDNDDNTGACGAFAHKELWSSSLLLTESGRRDVLQGHLDWLQLGGCNLISTVTYQCHYHEKTWPKANVIANESEMNELWKHGIQLASEALEQHASSSLSSSASSRRRPTFLVASSGCYGAALANGAEYTGDYGPNVTVQDLLHFHRRKLQQIMAVASCCEERDSSVVTTAVDCIAIETVPSLLELKALVQLLSEPETIAMFQQHHVAFWISLACGDVECLYDKTPLISALQVLQALPVDILPAIGLNCSDYRHLSSLANILVTFIANEQQLVDGRGRPRALVLYPNSGEEWDAVAKVFKTKATTTSTTAAAAAAEPAFVDCLIQVIETVETRWREKTQFTTTTTLSLPCYPRIIVGGCCRTTPTEIAALRVAIDEHLDCEKKDAACILAQEDA